MTKQKENLHKEGKLTKKIRENPWVLSTVILGILSLVLLFSAFISEKEIIVNIDSFAQCLTDSGLKMYGTEWCSYCKNQKELFGDSFRLIDYIDCDLYMDDCLSVGVEGYPTWIINNKSYRGVQSFKKLSELSGCKIQ